MSNKLIQVILAGVIVVGAGGYINFQEHSLLDPSHESTASLRSWWGFWFKNYSPPKKVHPSSKVQPHAPSKISPAPAPVKTTLPLNQFQAGGYGARTPFYNQSGIVMEHYWPADALASNFKDDETEFLVFNDTKSKVEITYAAIEYAMEGKVYPIFSGTWEKFPSRQSWDKIEYLNIGQGAYSAAPLILEAGQKGKLHYHMSFGKDFSPAKKQSVRLKLIFKAGGAEQTIDKILERADTTPGNEAPAGNHKSQPKEDHSREQRGHGETGGQIKTQSAKRSSIFGIPCLSNPNIIFDQSFAPLDQIEGIVPSGSAASEEIKPHSYVDIDLRKGETIPLYAPADLELVQGAYYYEPKTFKTPTTYTMHFQVSCEVIFMLDHISDPVAKIKAIFPGAPQYDTRMESILNPTVKFKKGELIGYTKGGGTQSANPPINRFDLGLYNTTQVNRFVNQARYEQSRTWKYINAVCAYDYFSPELRQFYLGKFRTLDKAPVPGAPCRAPNQDKAGRLSGAWFFKEDARAIEPHVGIILDLDGSAVIVGLPKMGNHALIKSNNPTFKDPGQVTSEHCYYDQYNNQSRVLYFRLLSGTKAEVYLGMESSCPSAFPSSGTIFLYR